MGLLRRGELPGAEASEAAAPLRAAVLGCSGLWWEEKLTPAEAVVVEEVARFWPRLRRGLLLGGD